MKNEALVSIIMPVYKTAPFIKEAVESVISQSYKNWELIIVNDCSPDKAKEIILSFCDDRIKYIEHEKNKGALEARNTAMRAACGRYIAFLDSDDLWQDTKLQKQVSFMSENNYSFTCTNFECIDEGSNSLKYILTTPKRITRFKFMLWNWCGCLTVMYDAQKIGKIYLENYAMRDDWALWIKVSRKSDCLLLDETLAFYRVRSGSQSAGGLLNLLKQHYKIFRYSEKKNAVASFFITLTTAFAFIYKKLMYKRRIK